MKKLNNKGFAVSTILYGILSLVIIILMLIFGVMKASKDMNEDLVECLTNSMNACVQAEYKLENCYFSKKENCSSFIDEYEKCTQYYEKCTQYGGIVDRTLRGQILLDNKVYGDDGIDFRSPSSETNGRGLYKTSDLNKTEDIDGDGVGEPVYYFRGAVENNYVQFGKYHNNVVVGEIIGGTYEFYNSEYECENASRGNHICKTVAEKDSYINWRIVRINEDGSIRLIYDGKIVKYMHTTFNQYYKPEYDKSYVETALNNFYTNYLKDYDSYIGDPGFCNDTTKASDPSYYSISERIGTDKHPQFACNSPSATLYTMKDNNKGNENLEQKIGMLTADEAWYAGNSFKSNNNDSYLLGINGWTMTPYCIGDDSERYVLTTKFDYHEIGLSISTVPTVVINLNKDVKVISASSDGTKNNPYIIVTES